MYCEYWNLHKAPFDNVPDPSMYTDCHQSMEKVISETIFAIKEGNEAFAVIIGGVGLGKTLSLRMIIDSLEPDKYKIVNITNPDISFRQLLKEIIGQITGKPCEENSKFDLLEIFHRLLVTTMDQGQKIVILIDEANALSKANLENLRLLTNMQDDQRNLFTLVLAGQMELAERLEHPKRANLFQRIGTYGRIDKLSSEEAVKTYIETRLKLAGTKIKIFSDDCIPVIWEYSEYGIPRLINKLCKLSLKVGETNNFDYISADIILQICERFQKLSKTAVQQRKPRNKPDNVDISDIVMPQNELEEIILPGSVVDKETQLKIAESTLLTTPNPEPEETNPPTNIHVVESSIEESPLDMFLHTTLTTTQPELENKTIAENITDTTTQTDMIEPVLQTTSSLEPEETSPPTDIPVVESSMEESPLDMFLLTTLTTTQPELENKTIAENITDTTTQTDMIEPVLQTTPNPEPEEIALSTECPVSEPPQKGSLPITPLDTQSGPEDKPMSNTVSDEETLNDYAEPTQMETNEDKADHLEQNTMEDKEPLRSENEDYDEITIGEHKIHLDIPGDILKQVKSFNRESANKSAGFWAAQIIKKNPQLTRSSLSDPVYIWNEIKANILKRIAL